MSNEWSNRKREIEDLRQSVASNTTMAAAQAVDIYRHVLEQLQVAESGRDA